MKKESNEILHYKTTDIAIATALITKGFEIKALDKANPKRVEFIFVEQKELKDVVDKYWSNNLEVKARLFFDNLRMLKQRIYNER